MNLLQEMNFNEVIVQRLSDEYLKRQRIEVSVLRLDKIHPVVSGNKWFKLKYYLNEAIEKNYSSIATFGGAFSNHILATAYASNKLNLQCTGFIRGEAAANLSQTLLDAQSLNMQLEFISRTDYKNKQAIASANSNMFLIPEGGYGENGAKGAAEILQLVPNLSTYNYIVCAAGTGTMLAGIINRALLHQCIGISVMKNNQTLEHETKLLLNEGAGDRVQLLHNYHFGGYSKFTQNLIDFMNRQWTVHRLPLDFVYTAKALYAIYDLISKKYFANNSNILFIHSGGLQGNRSLKKGTLLYQ